MLGNQIKTPVNWKMKGYDNKAQLMYTIYTKIRIEEKFKVMGAITISIEHHAPTMLCLFSLQQPCLFIHEEAH
jgi:hypothetical protein